MEMSNKRLENGGCNSGHRSSVVLVLEAMRVCAVIYGMCRGLSHRAFQQLWLGHEVNYQWRLKEEEPVK